MRASGLVESTVGSGTRVSLTKWGISPTNTPNWRQYTEGGTFLPNLPLMRRIREITQNDASIINIASGELSSDLFPNEIVNRILREQPFHEHLGYDDPQGYLNYVLPAHGCVVREPEKGLGKVEIRFFSFSRLNFKKRNKQIGGVYLLMKLGFIYHYFQQIIPLFFVHPPLSLI